MKGERHRSVRRRIRALVRLLPFASEVLRLPLGFDPSGLLRVDLSLDRNRLTPEAGGDEYVALFDPIRRRLESLPDVTAAGLVNTAPLAGGASTSFEIVGRPESAAREPSADIRIIDSGLLRTLRVPLLAGRGFDRNDSASSRRRKRCLAGIALLSGVIDIPIGLPNCAARAAEHGGAGGFLRR